MRIRFKGLNYSRKKLADGEIVTYWYAWRGGPRLDGQPGSAEFIASYNRAVAELPKKQTGTLDFILDKFQDSDAFLSRAPRTQSDYRKLLRAIANGGTALQSALAGKPIMPGACWHGFCHGRLTVA